MSLKAIKKQSAESLTVESLREAITTGHLPAGTRITEMDLAEQFQVSRGTVRIALYQLMREGIVDQTPYTGWAVSKLTAHDVWELYPLRAKLESLGAQLAAEQINDDGRTLLTSKYEQLIAVCKTGNRTEIARADFELHRAIVELSRNRRLLEHYKLIEQQFKIFLLASTFTHTDVKNVVGEHLPIVEAILSGNGSEAARLTEAHNMMGGQRLMNCVETFNEQVAGAAQR